MRNPLAPTLLTLLAPTLLTYHDRFEFATNEYINDIAIVTLETAATETGLKDFIAVGTTIDRGEDLAAKGAVSLLLLPLCGFAHVLRRMGLGWVSNPLSRFRNLPCLKNQPPLLSSCTPILTSLIGVYLRNRGSRSGPSYCAHEVV